MAERLAADGMAVGVALRGQQGPGRGRASPPSRRPAAGPIAVGGDVADEHAAWPPLFDAAEEAFGGVDVVVNAAGRMALAPIAELDLDDLDRMHRTNIRGTFVVAQQAARRVRAGGAIITFSTSVRGWRSPTYGAYAASKGAVEALTPSWPASCAAGTSPSTPSPPAPPPPPCSSTARTRRPSPPGRARPPAGAARAARRHRRGRRLPRRPARWVNGQVLFANGGIASDGTGACTRSSSSPAQSQRMGFGAMTARELARAGHTVYAGMRDTGGRNAPAVADAAAFAAEHGADLRTVELDVADQDSVDAAIARDHRRARTHGRDRAQRRAHGARPHGGLHPRAARARLRHQRGVARNGSTAPRCHTCAAQGHGLLVWVGRLSTRGGTPPYLAPYFAAKAAMDSLAVSYAAELARFGIDTSIVVPGSFTSGTNHFAHAGHAADEPVAAAYEERYAGLLDQVGARLAELAPPDADPAEVARVIVRVVDAPAGRRPFRVHVDPADDGAEVVNAVATACGRSSTAGSASTTCCTSGHEREIASIDGRGRPAPAPGTGPAPGRRGARRGPGRGG